MSLRLSRLEPYSTRQSESTPVNGTAFHVKQRKQAFFNKLFKKCLFLIHYENFLIIDQLMHLTISPPSPPPASCPPPSPVA